MGRRGDARRSRLRATGVIVAVLLAMPLPVSAEVGDGVSAGEFACQAAVARALPRQAANHARCVARCETLAARSGGAVDACLPPAYGGDTAACIAEGEARSRAAMTAACPEDGAADTCPEVYEARAGSCAGMAASRVATDHGTFSIFTGSLACAHPNLAGGDPAERARYRCETTLTRVLVRHFDFVNDTYARCNAGRLRGAVPPGGCAPGASSAPLSPGNVLAGPSARAAALIDARCFTPPALAPACYDGSPLRPSSGAGWVALVNAVAEVSADTSSFVDD